MVNVSTRIFCFLLEFIETLVKPAEKDGVKTASQLVKVLSDSEVDMNIFLRLTRSAVDFSKVSTIRMRKFIKQDELQNKKVKKRGTKNGSWYFISDLLNGSFSKTLQFYEEGGYCAIQASTTKFSKVFSVYELEYLFEIL